MDIDKNFFALMIIFDVGDKDLKAYAADFDDDKVFTNGGYNSFK